MKLSSRKQLLNEADKDLKRMRKSVGLNEDVSKVLDGVSTADGDRIHADLSTIKEKFFTEQTKKLNARYKSQLQEYVGQELTSELASQLLSFRFIWDIEDRSMGGQAGSGLKNYIGKKINSISFVVDEGYKGSLEIKLIMKLSGTLIWFKVYQE